MYPIVKKNFFITSIAVICAALFCLLLWRYYEIYPRTPDGRVRADIVQIAPDVSGLVTDVYVRDDQEVQIGDALFQIDKRRYHMEEEQAKALLSAKEVALAEAKREAVRNHDLGALVSSELQEQSEAKAQELAAAVAQAHVALDIAQLNLERATIRATVRGKITNFSLRPGQYAATGHPVFALIDLDSLHVDGYFEETKLSHIHLGDKAHIQLMGEHRVISGHVQGIAGGIEDRDRALGNSLLADVNPSFSWVRLAQRVPIRIVLDNVPSDIRLVIGRTAAVEILQDHANETKDAQP